MKEPTFNSDGYPTEETLNTIKEWGYDNEVGGFKGLMEFVRKAWKYSDTHFEKVKAEQENYRKGHDVIIYTLHTVGWSGNEDIIGALQDNMMFWALCWQESKRGGHYKFSV